MPSGFGIPPQGKDLFRLSLRLKPGYYQNTVTQNQPLFHFFMSQSQTILKNGSRVRWVRGLSDQPSAFSFQNKDLISIDWLNADR
jgi:hypothetical protein